MRLYVGSSTDFIDDTVHNRIADKLTSAYKHNFRFMPSASEVNSWKNSLRAVSQVFDAARFHDHGIALEYELPLSSMRLDCIITGRDDLVRDQAIIIELKQWDTCELGDSEKVVTWVAGGNREVLHPSVQVGQYKQFLEDGHTAFHEGPNPVVLSACAYLHNYTFGESDPILDEQFGDALRTCPLFAADDVDEMVSFMDVRLQRGQGMEVLRRMDESRYRPSKKLLDHVGKIVDGMAEYVLLDEQLVAYERVMAEARAGHRDRRKSVIVIRGGPGTGKSVIALNLVAALSKLGLNSHYATGSKAFTTTLRKIVGTRAAQQFKYFNSYRDAEYNEIDVLVCDEAHRIREKSLIRFKPAPDKWQIEELLHVAKVSVFFIDDKQIVRPKEIGSTQYILDAAARQDCRVFDYSLQTQFRCAGSDAFVSWVNNTLEIERTPHVLWNLNEEFDFRIFESPGALEIAIKERLEQDNTARLTAGFCWPWSDPLKDGLLVPDVQIGDFHRPWNARSGKGRLHRSVPPESLWAYDPRGVGQVGCIYTAQGFEFDYVGVIFGHDLVYRHDKGWVGQKEHSKDRVVRGAGDAFLDLVKNTYRVLLTRGLKGCFVYFMDNETEDFFRSRTENIPIEQ